MAEYIILLVILITILSSFLYLAKAMKSIYMNNEMISTENLSFNNKLLIQSNLEELEIDFLSQKLDEEEYNKVKKNLLDSLNETENSHSIQKTINISENDSIPKLICGNCKKELEADSKFCKYCGNKVII